MGKNKQSQRTKNNVVPASSGRSAELLQSSSRVPFVGFNTLKEGGFIPIFSGVSDELDININEDFRLVWKKMNKKDTTTKLKALDEFKNLCQDCDVEMLKPVLPYWPRLFCSLSTDEEHRVREAAHTAHRALVTKAGRNIAPYLKQLVGPWFTGQHDTYPPAASAAETAFQDTFPPNKLIEAIVFCQEEILNYICNNLLEQTPQTIAKKNCNQETKDAQHQRVVVSCLNGYALYLQRLPVDHLQKAEEANLKLVSSAKFWKLNKDPAPIVRAAWFTALVALCENAAFLLTNESKHVCMAVFSNLDETDPSVVHALWQAVLLTFNVVEDVWKYVSLEKMVLPKLWKVLKEGADGNASLVFPNLLPLLSKITPSLLGDKTSFYSKFFENLRIGLRVRSVQISGKETTAVVTTFLECLRYLINVNTEEEELCQSLFENQVFPLLEVVVTEPKLHLARPCLFCGLSSLVNSWSKMTCPPSSPASQLYLSLTTKFWTRLVLLCQMVLENNTTGPSTLSSICAAVGALITALKKPDIQPKKNFKVKFVVPRKSREEEKGDIEEEGDMEEKEKSSPTHEQPQISSSFESERSKFIKELLTVCFVLLESCSSLTKVILIGHLAQIIEEYESLDLFKHLLSITQLEWMNFYSQKLAQWLRDENIALDYSLRLIFTLLKYVESDKDVQIVYADLSGESALHGKGEAQLQPLQEKWQDVLEWALLHQAERPSISQWVVSHGGVTRLATLLSPNHPSYNILHKCLRNLRQNSWLTTEMICKLIKSLRYNLTEISVPADVKICSASLLHGMLQNPANYCILAHLDTHDLTSLLYELFSATLQQLEYFPSCWQQCVKILSLKSKENLSFSAVCETCVDILVAVQRLRPMDLSESQHLLTVLEDLIISSVTATSQDLAEESFASLTTIVLNRLTARLRGDCEAIWGLYEVVENVHGSIRECKLPARQFLSKNPKDPLQNVPLHQYITSMIPFLMMVVRLQTVSQQAEDISELQRLPYSQLRSVLPAEDLWQWTLEALQLHSVCISVKKHFANTKQYFLLKEKITFIIEECGLLSQLKVKDVIQHLNISLLEEGVSTLQFDTLLSLQRTVVVKDLGLLYSVHQIQKDCQSMKSNSSLVKQHYYPEEVLEEVATRETLKIELLPIVNNCYRRLVEVGSDVEEFSSTSITILDRVFDLYVAEEKENRSLLDLSDDKLLHIAEVADFALHSVTYCSAHMKQSSWDACLVATAALSSSISSTLVEWKERKIPVVLKDVIKSTTVEKTFKISSGWPLSLLSEAGDTKIEKEHQIFSLPLVRVMCAVCRLFDSVSVYMSTVSSEDKAGVTRRTEWTDVFLPGTHSAVTQAWRIVADIACERPTTLLLLEALSSSVAHFVDYPHYVDNDTLTCMDSCCLLLQSSEASVQLAAYHLLMNLIPAMLELDLKESEKDNVALSCQHVEKTLVYTQSIIEVILSELKFGDMCIVEPFTDSYSYTRCYLLLWCVLLELCSQASSQLRALYTTWLKEEYLPVFMKTVFCMMPEAVLHGDVPSQRITQFFSKSPQLDKGIWSSDRLAQLSCWVFSNSLRRLPAAIRQWWNEAEHRVYALVEHVTATYVSPDLCLEEMRSIQTHEKKFDNMTVHVLPNAKEVYAVYTVEESRMELVIELAHNHPLGLVKVKSGQRMVSTTQTRQWLLQITIFLTHQNGSIWDALELWKNSLDKRFEGVEECYICFAILHSVSHQLPKLSCQTCRKKFHSHCLYKWFTTSNKSTCPICRNLF